MQFASAVMVNEAKTQLKVAVSIEVFWKALAKDFTSVVPMVMPSMVKSVELIEGNGDLGSVFLFTFGQGVQKFSYQKEKVVELDESQHQFGLQVVEGGHLNHGFSSYTALFKLTSIAEMETLVDVKVVYETEADDTSHMPGDTTKASLAFLKRLEDYLLNQES